MSEALHLQHDVLDAQLVDRRGEKIGRCDVLLLELREGSPPRVATILVGGSARAERIGRWMSWLSRAARALFRIRGIGVSRIPFAKMRSIGDCMELDVLRDEMESEHLEQWLASHLVCRIPGAQGERK